MPKNLFKAENFFFFSLFMHRWFQSAVCIYKTKTVNKTKHKLRNVEGQNFFIHLMSNNKLNLWLHNWRTPSKKVLSKKEMRKPGEVSGLNVSYSCRCVSRVCHMIKKVIHMGQEEEQLWTCLVSQSFTEPYYEKRPLKNKFLKIPQAYHPNYLRHCDVTRHVIPYI